MKIKSLLENESLTIKVKIDNKSDIHVIKRENLCYNSEINENNDNIK